MASPCGVRSTNVLLRLLHPVGIGVAAPEELASAPHLLLNLLLITYYL